MTKNSEPSFLSRLVARYSLKERTSKTMPDSSLRTWVPPGHFYSPLVDPNDEHVSRILRTFDTAELSSQSGITLDDELILTTLDRIAPCQSEMPFRNQKRTGLRYYFANGAFEQGDGTVYFGILRSFGPRRVIEVGSGFSSALLMDVNDQFFDRSIDAQFIEPYPDRFNQLVGKDAFYKRRLIQSKVQDVDLAVFSELQAGDILFIDSSHVAKTGSDVNDYIFRILPALNSGVLIHIHDIPYPFEYPSAWIRQENRSWNEAYLLRAFLQFNSVFRIIYFNHYVFRRFRDLLADRIPKALENCGASIWLSKGA